MDIRKRVRNDEDNCSKVFVSNLPFNLDWQELKKIFSDAGPVVYAGIIKDKERNQSKGVGVVEYDSPVYAARAIELLNGIQLGGRPIHVRKDTHDPSVRANERIKARRSRFDEGPSHNEGFHAAAAANKNVAVSQNVPVGGSLGNMVPNQNSLDPVAAAAAFRAFTAGMTDPSTTYNAMNNMGMGNYGMDTASALTSAFGNSTGNNMAAMGPMLAPIFQQMFSAWMAMNMGSQMMSGMNMDPMANMGSQLMSGMNNPGMGSQMMSSMNDPGMGSQMMNGMNNPGMPYGAGGGGVVIETERGVSELEHGRVFVSNLNYQTTWQHLKDHFKTIGPVKYCKVMTDKEGKSKGTAVVEYDNPHDAQRAIIRFDNTVFGERPIYVKEDTHDGSELMDRPPRRANRAPDRGRASFAHAYEPVVHRPAPAAIIHEPQINVNAGPVISGYGGPGPEASGPGKKLDCKIVVHNLPFSYEASQLRDMFRHLGRIVDCHIAKDREKNRSKGWGTVTFENAEAAAEAIRKTHNSELHGRTLAVHLDQYTSSDFGAQPV